MGLVTSSNVVSALTVWKETSVNLRSSWFTVRLCGLTDERNDMSSEIILSGFYRSYIAIFANLTTSVFSMKITN